MGTSEAQVAEINSALPKIAHIYWIWNRNWSSDLWQKLYGEGWRMVSNKGLYTVKNPDGNEVFTCIGKVTALALLTDYVDKEKCR